jgi:hypothetical protein
MPGVAVWTADHLTVTSDAPAAVQIYVDAFRTEPKEITWGEPKLAPIVPEAYADKIKAMR